MSESEDAKGGENAKASWNGNDLMRKSVVRAYYPYG
jgi:hypothetical protein